MQPKKSFLKSKKLFKLIIPLIFLCGLGWVFGNLFEIKRIECQSNGQPCSQNLWAELMNDYSGKNILLLSKDKIKRQLQSQYPEFSQLSVAKKAMGTLIFSLKSRNPVAVIWENNNNQVLVNVDGLILGKSENNDKLPSILLNQEIDLNQGEKIQDKKILKALEIIALVQERSIEAESVKINSESSIELTIKDGTKVVLSTLKNINAELDSLQLIWQRAKIEGSHYQKIDLRFDKPVIVK